MPSPYLPEFLELRDGKIWPNDRPGLGVTVDEKAMTFVEEMTEGFTGDHPSASGRVADALVSRRTIGGATARWAEARR